MEEMNTDYDLSLINEKFVDINIQPSSTRMRNTNDYTNLNFTWEPVSFEGHVLKIKLNFISPLEISNHY